MSALAWFGIWTVGLPAAYLIGLAAWGRRRRVAQTQNKRSVAAIAARVKQERKQSERLVRWPQADPDRGAIRINRQTRLAPQVGRHARPGDDVRHPDN
ncbi:hypothetical protein FNH05_01750 [Amycolatopsis rhizosphaerae]|uniref:Uncharacterized protein n=1 Tax=Amycolatopsis rhizosphaerae TaxID=2053003 RepID=A0A558DLT1_9PSEU|nr:hypothetical protein [Amycolatopsis rhizosphaerae]TVT61981.1 hypothetical protein FNH05_01750 [Amycolatopsis rhizosphaerae]